jgi:hypothetical protein
MRRRWKVSLIALAIVTAIVPLVFWLRSHNEEKAAQQREGGYQTILRTYERTTTPGMTLKAVESQLRGQGTQFRSICCDTNGYADEVLIGEEPAPWFCSKQDVYISFWFRTDQASPSQPGLEAELKGMSITRRLETCL